MKILSLSPRLSILLCSAIVASSLGNQVFIAATPLDEQLLLLSKGISSQLRGKGVRRLAIADFSSIDQGQTALTRYLTEQFTTTLVTEQQRTFQLVDRNTVLAELKSQNKQKEEGLLDAATLSKFGKLAGVDSVLIGTVTTTSFALELNIKVLEVETGEIHGAIKGAVSIPPIPGRRLSDIPTPAQLLNVLTAAPTASESNSANARPTVVIKETAEQRKLREEAEKEEKRKQQEAEKEAKRQQKARQDQAQAFADAAIAGCQSGEVYVAARATGHSNFTSSIRVRVINLHNLPVNISDQSGEIVRNLCAGGSITLYRARVLFNDPDTIQYSYISTGKFSDGSLGRQQSQTFSMFSGQVNAQNYTWEIQLQKVYNQP